jgi:hypothetical protein
MSVTVGPSNITFNDGSVQTYSSVVGQCVTTVVTSTIALSTTNAWNTVTGLSASITPKSTSSKILVIVGLLTSGNGNTAGNINNKVLRLLRNGSVIGAGTNRGGEPCGWSVGNASFDADHPKSQGGMYLDSPATVSSVTYSLQIYAADAVAIAGGSYRSSASTGAYGLNSPNTITLMEILA